jgi:predicted phosphodiesterase
MVWKKRPSVERFAAISCPHVPFHCKRAMDWMLGEIEGADITTFVMLGDLFESSAASVHENDDAESHTLEDEYEEGAKYLDKIREVLHEDCQLVWCLGNHDDNILVRDSRRIPKDLRPLCNWNNHYEFGDSFRHWKQIDYIKGVVGTFNLGQCIFAHGWDCNQNSDSIEGLQLAYALGIWNCLTIRGHTHRPSAGIEQSRRTSKVLLPHWYCNVGHMRAMGKDRPQYMKRKDVSQWGNGIVFGEALTRGNPRRMDGKQWDAYLVTK